MPETHYYTARYWGHDYAIDEVVNDGQVLKAFGWGVGLQVDDYLLLANGNKSTRYRVSAIAYYPDPSDMWRATLAFAPRGTVS